MDLKRPRVILIMIIWPEFHQFIFGLWVVIYLGCSNKFPFVKICLVFLLSLLVLWLFYLDFSGWWGLIIYYVFITAVLIRYAYLSASLGINFEEDSDFVSYWFLESGFYLTILVFCNSIQPSRLIIHWNPVVFVIEGFYLFCGILLFVVLLILCYIVYKKKGPFRPKDLEYN